VPPTRKKKEKKGTRGDREKTDGFPRLGKGGSVSKERLFYDSLLKSDTTPPPRGAGHVIFREGKTSWKGNGKKSMETGARVL